MRKVIHVAAHLGGGIGKILSSLAIHSLDEGDIEHSIVILEDTKNKQFESICIENNIKLYFINKCDIKRILSEADIVQIDWWHHPLTSKFMFEFLEDIKCRLVIWSHVSGCTYPVIPPRLVDFPDKFIFSTKYSYESTYWSEEQREHIKNSTYNIVSSGLDINNSIEKKDHIGFNVGYIGFLSYSKTHPDFIKYYESVSDIPNIRFTVVGDRSYGEELINDSKKSNKLYGKIEFPGYSNDVYKHFSEFDVFGYILNPEHYGTAENVLLEAMASGVVPIVLNQGSEKYTVSHMVNGVVVNTIEEYREAMWWLYENPNELNRLSKNASKMIIDKYNIKNTIKELNNVYQELMLEDKKVHIASNVIGNTPYEWFLTCYKGDIKKIKGNAFAETKGSAKHYLKYFKDDDRLRKVVEENESRN